MKIPFTAFRAAFAAGAVLVALPVLASSSLQQMPRPPRWDDGGASPAPPAPAPPAPAPPAPAPPPPAPPVVRDAEPPVVQPPVIYQPPPVVITPPIPERTQPPVYSPPQPPVVRPAVGLNPADQPGFVYERRRIKRTVPLDPAAGLGGRWDLLYSVGTGQDRQAVYFNWDDDFLYLAAESGATTPVRFDIDARGDGWLRGADNISIFVTPPVQGWGLPSVTAQRWDNVQQRDRPVWAQSPIPATAMRTAIGRTPEGYHATLVAVPRTEVVGLQRQPGATFGFRTDFELPDATDPAALYAPRPMLNLVLANRIETRLDGLRVQVDVSPRTIVPGQGTRMVLDVRNEGLTPVRVARFFIRGSQAGQPLLDAASFTGRVLAPGETMRRDFHSDIAGGAGIGTVVVTGGLETEDGAMVSALVSLDRVEPFFVRLTLEDRPVVAGTEERRTALVAVNSRTNHRARGTVSLQLPAGWTVDRGGLQRDVTLAFAGDIRPFYYNIIVPTTATPGEYPIGATVQIDGRTYTSEGTLFVTRSTVDP